jgi:hypothetical protein
MVYGRGLHAGVQTTGIFARRAFASRLRRGMVQRGSNDDLARTAQT